MKPNFEENMMYSDLPHSYWYYIVDFCIEARWGQNPRSLADLYLPFLLENGIYHKEFECVEYLSFFAVKHIESGKERVMGDGVDAISDADGNSFYVGIVGFREMWEVYLNENYDTLEAYFPELVTD